MKNKVLFAVSAMLFSVVAFADQKATITCTGSEVVLSEKSPYMGEDSKFSQSLWVLKSKDSNDGESAYTAYFLNINPEGAAGREIYTGTNEVGGYFQVDIAQFQDVGDGTVIEMAAEGTLTYNHGPLKGTNEAVHCVKQ